MLARSHRKTGFRGPLEVCETWRRRLVDWVAFWVLHARQRAENTKTFSKTQYRSPVQRIVMRIAITMHSILENWIVSMEMATLFRLSLDTSLV